VPENRRSHKLPERMGQLLSRFPLEWVLRLSYSRLQIYEKGGGWCVCSIGLWVMRGVGAAGRSEFGRELDINFTTRKNQWGSISHQLRLGVPKKTWRHIESVENYCSCCFFFCFFYFFLFFPFFPCAAELFFWSWRGGITTLPSAGVPPIDTRVQLRTKSK